MENRTIYKLGGVQFDVKRFFRTDRTLNDLILENVTVRNIGDSVASQPPVW